MLIAQITDPHIVEPGGTMADRIDPTPGLAAAVAYLNSLGDTVDLVLGTGDLVNDGLPEQYDQLEAILSDLSAPFLALPGNHDVRDELRARFDGLPMGGPDDPIDHVLDVGDHVLVCLDTTIPGRHDGALRDEQLARLDSVLAEHADRHVLVVQHHPPFRSGIDSMDRYALAGADGEAEVIARHPNVMGLLAGHYHRAISRGFAGTVAFACPSTAVQLQPRLGPGPTTYCSDPGALALHQLDGGALTTHVVQLVEGPTWKPSWADDGTGPAH